MDSNTALKLSQESAERLWFVARGNVLKGPYTNTQLMEKVKKREFSFLDFCWRQGFNEWRPLGAVEDFDRRKRFTRLPQYPLVEVPASSGGGMYLKDTAPAEREMFAALPFLKRVPEKRKVKTEARDSVEKSAANSASASFKNRRFEVSFARHKRHSITIYEWGFAVMFAVVLSYYVGDYALTELSRRLHQHMGLLVAGTLEVQGTPHHDAVPPNFYDPLLSAPAFLEHNTLEKVWSVGLAPALRLPVVIEGTARKASTSDKLKVNDYTVMSASPLGVWDAGTESLDPVYRRPLKIFGNLDPKQALNIQISQKNTPYSGD